MPRLHATENVPQARPVVLGVAGGRERQSAPQYFVSDGEVDRTIALLGGDEREAVKALLYALHNMAPGGSARDGRAEDDGR